MGGGVTTTHGFGGESEPCASTTNSSCDCSDVLVTSNGEVVASSRSETLANSNGEVIESSRSEALAKSNGEVVASSRSEALAKSNGEVVASSRAGVLVVSHGKVIVASPGRAPAAALVSESRITAPTWDFVDTGQDGKSMGKSALTTHSI